MHQLRIQEALVFWRGDVCLRDQRGESNRIERWFIVSAGGVADGREKKRDEQEQTDWTHSAPRTFRARLVAVSQSHQPMFRLPFLVRILTVGGREESFVVSSRLFHLVQIIVRSCPQEQCFWGVRRDFLTG